MRSRFTITLVVAALLAVAACGNSSSSKPVTTPTGASGGGSSLLHLATAAEMKEHLPLKGVKGVTDNEIRVTVIADKTNILGGHYAEYGDGIKAYFDMINAQGGIYGRQLKIVTNRDSQMTANETQVKAALAQDNPFAIFSATVLFTGAKDLEAAKEPTFIWNINPEFAGKTNIFGSLGALCFTCTGQMGPWIAEQNHFKSIGILAYGVSAESKECAAGVRNSFTKFAPDIKIGFFDDNVQFAQPSLSAQVTKMKQANVQFVFTCMDQKETVILGKEMQKQHLDAVQNMPNAYDAQFMKDNAAIMEGNFVEPLYVPFEKTPLPPLEQEFLTQIHKENKPIYELTTTGWIMADMFVTGLKLAGPNFSQQKVIDALNRVTNYTASGMIVPIDWTRQHYSTDGGKFQFSSKYECTTVVRVHAGAFVPVYDQPGKPFVCFKGGPQATKLTTTPDYMSFTNVPLQG